MLKSTGCLSGVCAASIFSISVFDSRNTLSNASIQMLVPRVLLAFGVLFYLYPQYSQCLGLQYFSLGFHSILRAYLQCQFILGAFVSWCSGGLLKRQGRRGSGLRTQRGSCLPTTSGREIQICTRANPLTSRLPLQLAYFINIRPPPIFGPLQ